MILHENKKEFTEAIQAASDNLEISPVFIKKDYWITKILKELSQSKHEMVLYLKEELH
ncbi:MAG: hypothetical protein ACP5DQ_08145 [Bacteroidales bacterium]